MDIKLNDLDYLKALVKDREEVRTQFNSAIAALIQPTVLTAMFQLFELEAKDVEWNAIDIVDEVLVIVVKLTYTTNETTPQFLRTMDLISNAAPNARTRSLRVGIPLALAFGEHEAIKEYLIQSAEKMLPSKEPEQKIEHEFDPGALTSQQQEQLKLYQVMQKAGEKQ